MNRSQARAPELARLEALYDAHHRQALGLAYRLLGNMNDAEECVQEVFLSAWRSGHTYDAVRGTTHAWLLSMVRNRSIDILRARKRRPVQPLAEGMEPPDISDVPAQAVANVDAQAARAALDSLPAEQKQAIELAYFGGLSHSEIADQLAAPLGTVKGRIRLGLDRLRTLMGVQLDALSTR
ncbi:MAG: sigma-70 family RNA polymerase sigma factor [Chloroflexota bacterium]|nr:sigma-70 family RNA polymerase sigma factor [Chloroflexota bacterium]